MSKPPVFPTAYFAILKTGATVVPLNVLSTAREIAYYLNDCNAKVYFCFQGTPEWPMAKSGYDGFQQAGNCEHFWVMIADLAAPSGIEGTISLAEKMMAPQPTDFDMVSTNPDDAAVILYTHGRMKYKAISEEWRLCEKLNQFGESEKCFSAHTASLRRLDTPNFWNR